MIPLSAEEAGRALDRGPLAGPVAGVTTDSRSVRRGDLFVALRGERFDGHEYLAEAFAGGASAAVVAADSVPGRAAGGGSPGDPQPRHDPGGRPLYVVPDTMVALGRLSRAVRRKSRATVVAITGSVGKTSTKDLILAMAAETRSVVGTQANRNNEIGLPLTLLELRENTEIAVVEMGMRGAGQVAALAAIAEPDVGLVTSVAPVHLELLGSVEAIGRAKAELLRGLRPGGVAVIPAGVAALEEAAATLTRTVRFGLVARSLEGEQSVPGIDVVGFLGNRPDGAAVVELRWPGGGATVVPPFKARHRLENIVPALAACYAAGLAPSSCLRGLKEVGFSPQRGDEITLCGVLILDDTYNANPPAMRSALDTLVAQVRATGGRAFAILGDMLELGPEAPAYHAEVGEYAAQVGVEVLWGVGANARLMVERYAESTGGHARDSRWFAEAGGGPTAGGGPIASAVARLAAELVEGDVVLVKASRGMRLEGVVDGLRRGLTAREM